MLQKHVCSNGVRIVHEKMPYLRSVAIGLWVGAGSVDETKEEAGLAHFIEHMLFKGTTTRSSKVIAEQFDQIGGDINAFTSKEMTCFYTTVLGHQASYALTILADMFFNSVFDAQEIEKEKMVILDEIASVEDAPDEDVDERLWATMFPKGSLGKPIGGNEASILSFNADMIRHFINRLYVPERIVISIAGNYDDRLIKLIEAHFGTFQRAPMPLQVTEEADELFTKGITTKARDIEQAHLSIGFPGLTISDDHLYDLILLDNVIGGTMSSKLFQQVREERGLAYSIYSYYATYRKAGAFGIYCGTSPSNLLEAIQVIDQTLVELLQNGVQSSELHNAKEQLKGSFLLGLESSESRMHRNGKNELMLGKHLSVDEVVEHIQQVEVRNVYRMAQRVLQGDRVVSIIAPAKTIQQFQFKG